MVYRGVSDSRYDLTPSVLREDGPKKIKEVQEAYAEHMWEVYNLTYPKQDKRTKYEKTVKAEKFALHVFCSLANEQGLNFSIPSNFRGTPKIMGEYNKLEKSWMHSEYEEVAALAQHYGMPTRLLDWTFDFRFALYNAVFKAAKKIIEFDKNGQKPGEYSHHTISLWILNKVVSELNLADKLIFVLPSYGDNPNICAQKGVLTYWRINKATYSKEDCKSLDELISSEIKLKFKDEDIQPGIFPVKISLTYGEIPKAMDYLIRERCYASKYFPGYGSLQNTMDELCVISKIRKIFNESA